MCADVLLWKTVLSKNGRREWIKKEYKGKEMGRLTKEGIEGGVGGRGGGGEREVGRDPDNQHDVAGWSGY